MFKVTQMHKKFKGRTEKDINGKDDELRIQCSLPPEVKGQLRCFLSVTVDHIKWQVDNHPKDIQVCLQWWGEKGNGTMFWPKPVHGKKSSHPPTSGNTVLFPVCSGPKQFAAYLKDMTVLLLDVLHSKSLKPFGRVEIPGVVELNGTNPIDKWYPVTSRSVQPVKFADLHVALKFEPVDVVGQDFSLFVPVIDHDFKNVDNDNNNPRKNELEESVGKVDTIEPGSMPRNEELHEDNVIISLIERGQTLRNSIIEASESLGENIHLGEKEELERSISGSLFKEILRCDTAEDTSLTNPDISFPVVQCGSDESEDIELLCESRSSVGSESDDPMHDETLLQDLFYVNKVSSIIPTINESRQLNSVDADIKKSDPEPKGDKEPNENSTPEGKLSTGVETGSVRKEKEPLPVNIGHDIVHDDICSRGLNIPVSDNMRNKDFLAHLGVNKLTALGRVTAARVHMNQLNMLEEFETSGQNKRTYFIEYEFPVASPTDHGSGQSEKNDVGLEMTRIATKKTTTQSIVFNHHSVFPVYFDSSVIKYWCDYELKINIFERKSGQKSPILIGYGKIGLLSVLTSENLQYEGVVAIKVNNNPDKSGRSSQSSSTSSSDGPLLGELEIKIYLMSNGKDLNYHAPPVEQMVESSEIRSHVGNDHFLQSVKTEEEPRQVLVEKPEIPIETDQRRSVPLTTLLWVSEGRNIIRRGHGLRVSVPGSMTRSNLYLISRMFWTSDTSRSSICWGQNDPKFNFKQIFPVLLTSALLDRMHNNFLTLEVWGKTGGTQEDELVGIAKLPLQQLYLSYKDEKTAQALLKSKFPVVGVDGWISVGNPFKGSSHGELHVLLALGSDIQINRLVDIKECSDQRDYFQQSKDRLQSDISAKHSPEKHVEHWFELSVQSVRKLSAFDNTWVGETDCFVQYNFPYQKPDAEVDMNVDLSQDVPGLQNHRTATTLCMADTNFNDVARYRIILPWSLPVQRYLLAAYHGSWSGAGMSAAASVAFELWKRHYYPNIRDQLVAKAILPLSKLCGIVTMQKPGEISIQSFSLPLATFPNPSAECSKSEAGGILDITIKYRQSKLAIPHTNRIDKNTNDINSQVCLAIEVIRACGLKCALSELAKKDSSLTYPSEVGGNIFVKIKLPFNIRMNERTTRTIARTFTPEFCYRMEFILPLVLKDNVVGRDSQEFSGTLAECLEFGEVVLELWHQRPQQSYGDLCSEEIPVGQGFYQRQLPPNSDALLGVVKIPLQQLLFSHTGIRGWFPVSSRTLSWSDESDDRNSLDRTVGGLEIIINLSESIARERIIESGRAVGWCPPLWYELEDGQWLNDTVDNGIVNVGQGVTFLVSIKRVWIPKTLVAAERTRQGMKGNKQFGCYIRYKFYDTKAVFSSICEVKKIKESENTLCDLRHRHSYIVKTTSPFIWYIREERLEIQVWLTSKHHDNTTPLPHKRDKLVGSAFVALFPLLDGSKHFSQISGLYSLFRSSAVDLCGAGLHVQLVLQKPPNSDQTLFGGEIDEDIASTEHSESVLQEKDSLTVVSSDEEDSEKDVGRNTQKDISLPKDDKDVITAHVVIERALHLPLVKTDKNESVQPNVYVTYQPKPEVNVIKTKISPLSSSPVWAHEKVAKFHKATISKQMLTFKVWHSQRDYDKTSNSKSDEGDLLLGIASIDLSPLASGLRQVMGWYNIVNFSGQCQGQIKVGVIPLLSVSPERDVFLHLREHTASKRQTMDLLSKQSNENTSGRKDHPAVCASSVKVPDSSKSFLLRQLRQNLNDLDVIKDKLSRRLMANNECVESSCYKQSDKCDGDRPGDGKELKTKLECLTTYPVNDEADLLQFNRTVHSTQDKMSAVLSNRSYHEDDPESLIRHTSVDSDDINQHSNVRYQVQDSRNLSDVHGYGVNGIEHDQDYTSFNNRTNSDPSYCNDDDDSDDGDNVEDNDDDNSISEVNHLESVHDSDYNDHISDHLNVGKCQGGSESNQNKDFLISDNHDMLNHSTDFLTSDKHDTTEDYSSGPTVSMNQSLHEPSDNISPKNLEHSRLENQKKVGDELLDSFFDCVKLKQRSEAEYDVEHSDGTINDMVEPESVVSRTNLSKLRNVLHDSKSKDEQTTSFYEHRPDLLCTDANNEDNEESLIIQSCGDKKDSCSGSSVLYNDAAKSVESKQEQRACNTLQKHHDYGTLMQKASIPNFFMPPKDLEQSMRSLRLAATFRNQPRRDNEKFPKEQVQVVTDQEPFRSGGKSFPSWKKLQEIRTTGEIPLSSEETSRLARIFSSSYSTKK